MHTKISFWPARRRTGFLDIEKIAFVDSQNDKTYVRIIIYRVVNVFGVNVRFSVHEYRLNTHFYRYWILLVWIRVPYRSIKYYKYYYFEYHHPSIENDHFFSIHRFSIAYGKTERPHVSNDYRESVEFEYSRGVFSTVGRMKNICTRFYVRNRVIVIIYITSKVYALSLDIFAFQTFVIFIFGVKRDYKRSNEV